MSTWFEEAEIRPAESWAEEKQSLFMFDLSSFLLHAFEREHPQQVFAPYLRADISFHIIHATAPSMMSPTRIYCMMRFVDNSCPSIENGFIWITIMDILFVNVKTTDPDYLSYPFVGRNLF